MRLLQVDIGAVRVDLHPYVSIVRGLRPDVRAQFLAAVEALPAGSTSGLSGLVEAYGVMLDLTPDTLALLDLGGEASREISPVVRAGDLPFTAAGPEAMSRAELRRRRAALVDALGTAEDAAARTDRLRAASEEALAELEGNVDPEGEGASAAEQLRSLVVERGAARAEAERRATEAGAADGRAAEAHAVAVTALAAARQRRAELTRACALATGALEATRAARDPFAASALDVARQLLVELEQELESGRGPDDTPGFDDLDSLDARLADLDARRAPIEVALLAVDAVDPFPVEVALAHAEAADSGELVPDPDALVLADELAVLDAQAEAAAAPEVGAEQMAQARRRLEEAQEALAEAERSTRAPVLDRDQVHELEEAHAAVLGAQDKADSRFGGTKARQRLDEAREEEQVVLDRLGFLTYADFVMGTSIRTVDPEREDALDAARAELAGAEAALAQLTAGVDAQLADIEREARRRELLDRAAAILGSPPGADAEWLLRSRRIDVTDHVERYDRLRDALAAAGVDVYGDNEPLPGPIAIELARVWLEEREETAASRAELEHELGEIDKAIAECRQARQEAEGVASEAARRARAEARVEEARATLAAAEARATQNAKAAEELDGLKAELEAKTAQEAEAAAGVAEAERAEADAAAHARALHVERSNAQAELAAALDAELATVDELREVDERLRQGSGAMSKAVREDEVAAARLAASAALEELQRLRAELATVDERLAELPASSEEDVVDADEIEWYLLSRLAAQRNVTFAGSVPLVLDDAFAGLPDGASVHLVERLERMANAVQVIVVSDDEQLATWADAVGVDRAATLLPEALS